MRAAGRSERVNVGRTLKSEDGQRTGPKESLRWIEGYERIAEMAPELADTRLVHVADREADLMPLMARAQQLGTPADWLARAKHNRCLAEGDKLGAHTTEGLPLGKITFQMTAAKDVKARPLRQQLWARRVELPAGKGRRYRPRASSHAKLARPVTRHRSNGAC